MSDKDQPFNQTSNLPTQDKPEITNQSKPLMKTEVVNDTKETNLPLGENDKTPATSIPQDSTDFPDETFSISGSSQPPTDQSNPPSSVSPPTSPTSTADESVPVTNIPTAAADSTYSAFKPPNETRFFSSQDPNNSTSPVPKKPGKKKTGVLIAILFILLTIPASVFLAKINQDIRQKAARGELCESNGGQCVDPNLYTCASFSTNLNDCSGAPTIKCGFNCYKKGTNPSPTPTPRPTPTSIPGYECRNIVLGADCVPANWNCQEDFGRVDCKRNPLEKCGYKCTGPTPPPPPNDCTTNGGTCYPTNYSCTGSPLPYECYSGQICYKTGACTPPPVCNPGTRGYTRDINAYIQVTQCDVNECNNRAGGDGVVYVTHYTCPNVNDPAGGCQLNGKNVNFTLNTPIYFDKTLLCGTQQIDIGCKDTSGTYGSLGFLSTLQWDDNICQVPPTPKPTPPPRSTPTPPPVGAQCVAIKIYQVNGDIGDAANWQLLTPEQLAVLQPGDIIYVTTLGAVQNGIIDKARIRVNSDIWTVANETTLKKPGSNEFYISYTIPNDGTTTFNFGAEIHEANTNKWY